MMTERDLKLYLEDISESLEQIQKYTKGMPEKDFYQNSLTQDAVLRRLEIIGEAVKNIPLNFRNQHPDIPWKKIAGFRDVLIHGYFGVNLKRVWTVIKKDLPELKKQIKKLV